MKNRKIKIAIIDSGVNYKHPELKDYKISGITLKVINGKINVEDDIMDYIGHGTAIFFLLNNQVKLYKNIEIYNIKLFDNQIKLSQNDFLLILNYILENYNFNLINLSFGIHSCNYKLFHNIFDKFSQRNTIIVSAYDNKGYLSYPAIFNNVIGVSVEENIDFLKKIYCIENSPINIIGYTNIYRVPWIDEKYNFVKGSSFFCPEVTAKIAISLGNGQDIFTSFDNKIVYNKYIDKQIFSFENIAIFPFSKEEKVIACFEKMINCNSISYFSTAKQGHVGKKISDVLHYCSNDKIIYNIKDINFDKIDTLVIGHMDNLSKIENVDYIKTLVEKSLKYNIKYYFFDPIMNNVEQMLKKNNKIYYSPSLNKSLIIPRFGKLYKTNIPVVCITGTSSSQGKFTLQLKLRKNLLNANYKIGQIGTEPSSFLFGFDEVFPNGYNASINLSIDEIIQLINQQLWKISEKEYNLILCGLQSGLAPISHANSKSIPIVHQLFLEVIKPDVIVLCINPYDEYLHIKKCLLLAEALSFGKVIAMVCFPQTIKNNWMAKLGEKKVLSNDEFNFLKTNIKKWFNLPLFRLDDDNQIIQLTNNILKYFERSAD